MKAGQKSFFSEQIEASSTLEQITQWSWNLKCNEHLMWPGTAENS